MQVNACTGQYNDGKYVIFMRLHAYFGRRGVNPSTIYRFPEHLRDVQVDYAAGDTHRFKVLCVKICHHEAERACA